MGLPRVECSQAFSTRSVACGDNARSDAELAFPNDHRLRTSVSTPDLSGKKKRKAVTFPLDVLFSAAVRDSDVDDIVQIVKTLAPVEEQAKSSGLSKPIFLPLNWAERSRQGGFSALHLCSLAGQLDCVRALVESGADIFSVDNSGWTPLHVAAWAGHMHVVRYLVKRGGTELLTYSAHPSGKQAVDVARKEDIRVLLSEFERCAAVVSTIGNRTPTRDAVTPPRLMLIGAK